MPAKVHSEVVYLELSSSSVEAERGFSASGLFAAKT